MNMLVPMGGNSASLIAKGIFQSPFIVKHLMDQAFVKESFKRPVNGYTIGGIADLLFYVAVRKCVLLIQKKMQNLLPGWRGPQTIIF
jgi:hypothetical protein